MYGKVLVRPFCVYSFLAAVVLTASRGLCLVVGGRVHGRKHVQRRGLVNTSPPRQWKFPLPGTSSLPNLRLDQWELRSINFTTFRKAIPNGSIRMETLWATVAARLVTATARQPSAGFKSNER